MNLTTKDFAFDVKALSETGEFEGYGSVFGVVDLGMDVVERGAFTKTIQERPNIKLLWQHDQKQPIGIFTEAYEDDHGLYMKGQLNLDVRQGREAYALLKQGAMDGMSIGYQTVKYRTDEESGIRYITELKLWETSLVTFPMNEVAQVSAVKSAVEDLTEEQTTQVMSFINALKGADNTEESASGINNLIKALRGEVEPQDDSTPTSISVEGKGDATDDEHSTNYEAAELKDEPCDDESDTLVGLTKLLQTLNEEK